MQPDPAPTDTTDGTWGGEDLAAVKLLTAHQRRDIGHCMCGWGVDTGDLGRSHALHMWRALQAEVLPTRDARVRAQVAQSLMDWAAAQLPPSQQWLGPRLAEIARAHTTTGEDHDDH